MMSNLCVAQLGKVVGLKGDLKLHNESDFVEQFKIGSIFTTQNSIELKISSFDKSRMIVRFVGYEDRDRAQTLTNSFLFTTLEATKSQCKLKKDEYFWFDIIGCEVVEGGEILGKVVDIERIGVSDYLSVDTSKELVDRGLCESFLIPYIDRYVESVELESKKIITNFAKELLESL